MAAVTLGPGGKYRMEPLTVAQAQWFWDQRANLVGHLISHKVTAPGSLTPIINDWLFELLVEQGFDVRDDVVVKL